MWAGVGQQWTSRHSGRWRVSDYRGMARSTDRHTAGGRPFLTLPRCHRRNTRWQPPHPQSSSTSDMSASRLCIYHPRVVHSWRQDQPPARYPLDGAYFQRTGLIFPETVGTAMVNDDKPQDRAGDEPDRTAPTRAIGDVTLILSRIEQGEPQAAEQLLPLVYEELRKLAAAKMAQEKPDQTLQATALVHEAYIRLVDVDKAQHWDSRRHFFAAAAEAMRRILVDGARRKQRLKRGGNFERVDLDELEIAVDGPEPDIVALDEALGKLAKGHPVEAELVKLRFFAGMTLQEASQTLGLSSATGDRKWAYAKAWLYREVTPPSEL